MERLKACIKRLFSWEVFDVCLFAVFLLLLFLIANRYVLKTSGRGQEEAGLMQFFGKYTDDNPYHPYDAPLEDAYPSPAVQLPPFCERPKTPPPIPYPITAILTFSEYEFFGVRRILEGILLDLFRRNGTRGNEEFPGDGSDGESRYSPDYRGRDAGLDRHYGRAGETVHLRRDKRDGRNGNTDENAGNARFDYRKGNTDVADDEELVLGESEGNTEAGKGGKDAGAAREGDFDPALGINAWRHVMESVAEAGVGDFGVFDVIIVVDDATSLPHITREYSRYFGLVKARLGRLAANGLKTPKFVFKRHSGPENAGTPGARMLAVNSMLRTTTDGVLVFLDPSAAFNRHWLIPLVDHVVANPRAVAQPHLDKLRSPVHTKGQELGWTDLSPEGVVTSLTWALSERPIWAEGHSNLKRTNSTPRAKPPPHIPSPLLRGATFAVRETYFREIGGYETRGLGPFGGGQEMDLALKVWTSCGSVDVVTCSRAAVENLDDSVAMRDVENVKYIVNKWFKTKEELLLRQYGVRKAKQPFKFIPEKLSCGRDFDWFSQNVATNLFPLSNEAIRFGALRVHTGRCARLLEHSRKVKLDECDADPASRIQATQFFEMTRTGHLKVKGRCLSAKPNAFIKVEECVESDNTQQWLYRDETLVNIWSSYCAMHVTDPDQDAEGDRQIMMVQDCKLVTSKENQFDKWTFITV